MSQVTFTDQDSRNYNFRRPLLGNSDSIAFQRINRRTRGGDIIIFRDNEWPKTEVLNLTFDFTTDDEAQAMMNMLRYTAGWFIHYRDHENRLWFGIVQNPDTEVSQTGINHFMVEVRFEGDQV